MVIFNYEIVDCIGRENRQHPALPRIFISTQLSSPIGLCALINVSLPEGEREGERERERENTFTPHLIPIYFNWGTYYRSEIWNDFRNFGYAKSPTNVLRTSKLSFFQKNSLR